MPSGGGGSQTVTQKSELPDEVKPYLKNLLTNMMGDPSVGNYDLNLRRQAFGGGGGAAIPGKGGVGGGATVGGGGGATVGGGGATGVAGTNYQGAQTNLDIADLEAQIRALQDTYVMPPGAYFDSTHEEQAWNRGVQQRDREVAMLERQIADLRSGMQYSDMGGAGGPQQQYTAASGGATGGATGGAAGGAGDGIARGTVMPSTSIDALGAGGGGAAGKGGVGGGADMVQAKPLNQAGGAGAGGGAGGGGSVGGGIGTTNQITANSTGGLSNQYSDQPLVAQPLQWTGATEVPVSDSTWGAINALEQNAGAQAQLGQIGANEAANTLQGNYLGTATNWANANADAYNQNAGVQNAARNVQNQALSNTTPNAYAGGLLDSIMRDVNPAIASKWAGSGRTSGAGMEEARARGIAQAFAPHAFGAAEAERGRQVAGGEAMAGRQFQAGSALQNQLYGAGQEQAARQFQAGEGYANRGLTGFQAERENMQRSQALLPQVQQGMNAGASNLAQAGEARDNIMMQQQNLQSAIADFYQMEPWQRAGMMANFLYGYPGAQGTSTTRGGGGGGGMGLGGILGGASSGAGLAAMMGAAAGGPAMIGAAGLGGLLGLFG